MNIEYTKTEYESFETDELFNQAVEISNNILIIKEALGNINKYIDSLNDDKVWNSPASNYLKERFQQEKVNLEKTYNELLLYQKNLFDVSTLTEEAYKKAAKIMSETEIKTIWQV